MEKKKMKVPLTALLVAVTATVAQAAKPTPSIENLQAEFEKRVLAGVKLDGDRNPQEIMMAASRIARDVFGKHPEVLHTRAKELLRKLPALQPNALAGYVEKHNATIAPGLLAADETVFLAYGWQPERVAAVAKNIVLARNMSVQQTGQRALLTQFVPDKVYLLPDRKVTTLAVKSLRDFILVELRLENSGVFVPVSVTWMVEKTPEQQDQRAK
jgi:hypothetical protein